jgi:hypothetical protein
MLLIYSKQYCITVLRAMQVLFSSTEINVVCLQGSNVTDISTKFRASFILKCTLLVFYLHGHLSSPSS